MVIRPHVPRPKATTHGTSTTCQLTSGHESKVNLTSQKVYSTVAHQIFVVSSGDFGLHQKHLIVESGLQDSLSGGFDAQRIACQSQMFFNGCRCQFQ